MSSYMPEMSIAMVLDVSVRQEVNFSSNNCQLFLSSTLNELIPQLPLLNKSFDKINGELRSENIKCINLWMNYRWYI